MTTRKQHVSIEKRKYVRKFTAIEILDIREMLDLDCYTLTEIGEMYGVTFTTIRRIRDRTTYNWVED